MNRLYLAIGAFVAWSLFAGWIGWEIRDGRADFAAVKAESTAAQAQTAAVTGARATDHANAAASHRTEATRVQRQARTDAAFQQIDQEVARYAAQHPAPPAAGAGGPALACVRGPADADFMRIWRAQNAGAAAGGESGHPDGAAAAPAEHDSRPDRGDRPRAVGEPRAGGPDVPRDGEPGERADLHAAVAGRRADQWRDAEASNVV